MKLDNEDLNNAEKDISEHFYSKMSFKYQKVILR